MYLVMTSSANSPAGKKWSGYRNLAIVELEPGVTSRPKMISERAIGVKRIVAYAHSVYVGARGHGADLLASYERRAAALNAAQEAH